MSTDARRFGLVAALLALALLGAYARPLPLRAADPPPAATAAQAPRGPDPAYVLLADSDWWTRTPDEVLLASPYDLRPQGDLASLPRQLGEWRGEDEPQGDTAWLTLGAKQHLLRRYTSEAGGFVWLRLLASVDWNMFHHTPPTCYRASGWTLAPESSYAVPLGEATLRLRGFEARRPEGAHLVLYGFLWGDQYRDMAAGTTLVEVIAPLGEDKAAAERQAREFAGLLFSDAPGAMAAGAPQSERRVDKNLDDAVALLGYDLSAPSARPGAQLRLTLYWQALRPLAEDYTVFVQLLRPASEPAASLVLAQVDAPPYANLYPTSRWRVGQTLKETYELHLPPEAPAGEYELVAGMYRLADGRRLGEAQNLATIVVGK
ncbi:MAG: exosortase-associated EpsI family protein [Chloroflexota bacterium]